MTPEQVRDRAAEIARNNLNWKTAEEIAAIPIPSTPSAKAQFKPGDPVHTTGACESNGVVLAVYDAGDGTLRASVRHEGDGKGFFIHHYRLKMLAPGHVETRATAALKLAEEALALLISCPSISDISPENRCSEDIEAERCGRTAFAAIRKIVGE